MRTPHRHRSRAYLDRILEGQAVGADPLIGFVEQIQAPPRRRETRGLRAASSAFVWAPAVRPYLPPHHRTGLSSAAAQVWHPRVLIGALTIIVAATIAIASTGNSSAQHSPASVTVSGIAAQLSAQASASAGPVRPSDSGRSSPVAPVIPPAGATGSSSASAPGAASTPAPSATDTALFGPWCQQWLARPSDSSSSANNPIYRLLVGVAGGPVAINAYCNALLNGAAPSAAVTTPAAKPATSPQAKTSTAASTPTPTPTS